MKINNDIDHNLDFDSLVRNLFWIDSDIRLISFFTSLYCLPMPIAGSLDTINPSLYKKILEGRMIEEMLAEYEKMESQVILECLYRKYRRRYMKAEFINNLRDFKIRFYQNKSLKKSTFANEYIEELIELQEKIHKHISSYGNSFSEINQTHFSLNPMKLYDIRGLRADLVNNNLISPKTKTVNLRQIFIYRKNRVQINWIGGKNKLACFLKLMKGKDAFLNNYIYSIAKYIFTIEGNKIDNLVHPKSKDYKKYRDNISALIDQNICLKDKRNRSSFLSDQKQSIKNQ